MGFSRSYSYQVNIISLDDTLLSPSKFIYIYHDYRTDHSQSPKKAKYPKKSDCRFSTAESYFYTEWANCATKGRCEKMHRKGIIIEKNHDA